MEKIRPNSSGNAGAAWGDEGKGKFSDYIVDQYAKKMSVVDFGLNGGANAGHNIKFDDISIALHQLPSGIFVDNVTAVMGRSKVINPQGLVWEIEQVKKYSNNELKSSLKINERASLALRTHQALELALKRGNIGNGATGQGIGPAYADQDYRNELSVKDLFDDENFETKFGNHYDRFNAIVKSLTDTDISQIEVPVFSDIKGEKVKVGTKQEFLESLKEAREYLRPYVQDVYDFIQKTWHEPYRYAYFFEASQAVGLHREYGIHPDVTASDTTFYAINASTEGLVNYREVDHRIAVMKATYSSSVGSRRVPTLMPEDLADRIRVDYNEMGATTGRKRDIAYIDLPALRYYFRVSGANEIGITHMDATYPEIPIKICDHYQKNDIKAAYRPYQDYLNEVQAKFIELPTWDSKRVNLAKNFGDLPSEAKDYINYIERELSHDNIRYPVTLLGTGPKREDVIKINA